MVVVDRLTIAVRKLMHSLIKHAEIYQFDLLEKSVYVHIALGVIFAI